MSYQWLNLAKADGANVIFGRVDGTTIHDSAGGNNATLQSAAAPGPSLIGSWFVNSLICDGTANSHATVPDGTDFDVTDTWSIELVVKTASQVTGTIIQFGTAAATNSFVLYNRGTATRMQISSVVGGVNVDHNTGSNSQIPGDTNHWVFTRNSGVMALYKNGTLDSFTSDTVTPANAANVFIGTNEAGTAPYTGSVGPIAIYKNAVLTATQARAHYNATVRPRSRFRLFNRRYRRR